MTLTNFDGVGVGFGFGIGCGFGVGWGFGGMIMLPRRFPLIAEIVIGCLLNLDIRLCCPRL
ncbi:hypothetical protein SLEP1_g16647 [Rubroshorea leprosula]|uniref:Uncharacterized protein n=1 Tax=Rubroshorea leprosula TaxID=152421 RepID=A0AAV5J246_9ROSI|nr:hypothetical protein SLEP1_g16647 [Rubroshorea leprosula]